MSRDLTTDELTALIDRCFDAVQASKVGPIRTGRGRNERFCPVAF